MKKILMLLVLLCSLAALAQDAVTSQLKTLSDNKEYKKIIIGHAPKSADYPAGALYYIGLAYYMEQDDNNCLDFIDRSIQKDATNPSAHYIKATTLNYMGSFEQAIPSFKAAIALKPTDPLFYAGLGESYYNLKQYDAALDAFTKATQQPDCPTRPYMMVAQVYSDQNKTDKALEAYYTAKAKISKESESYTNVLFNIGLIESLNGNYDKAEPAFLDLIKLDPEDYHSYAKLIQVYYHKKQYDKAKPYRDKLYAAYKKGLLKDNMADMYCFDQFAWKEYRVQVFERYQEGNASKIYNKHIFYVVDANENIVLRVQTEYSPISVEQGGAKYLLCASKGNTHFNSGQGFNDDVTYENLKAAAIKMIEEHM